MWPNKSPAAKTEGIKPSPLIPSPPFSRRERKNAHFESNDVILVMELVDKRAYTHSLSLPVLASVFPSFLLRDYDGI